eukprot:TRINITY_DN27160_c0_g1_i3.p1 TRINITY_DN27160_c0_g1~~TRINITY_DN27160_c0_g1_i3.p1  ORF type:complete len:178 (+),score=34.33 TRINITY_DN27160_c0_g1_i3:247-780(+)
MIEMDPNQRSQSYYNLLGVGSNSSVSEIRRAYRKLAMQWHPDKWTRKPLLAEEAKRKFQQIQEAYDVLSDQSKRALYDAGLYDPDGEEVEGFSEFVQEMLALMSEVRKEEKSYSVGDLQQMLMEMAQGFDTSPSWTDLESSRPPKRARHERDPLYHHLSSNAHIHLSVFEMFGNAGY